MFSRGAFKFAATLKTVDTALAHGQRIVPLPVGGSRFENWLFFEAKRLFRARLVEYTRMWEANLEKAKRPPRQLRPHRHSRNLKILRLPLAQWGLRLQVLGFPCARPACAALKLGLLLSILSRLTHILSAFFFDGSNLRGGTSWGSHDCGYTRVLEYFPEKSELATANGHCCFCVPGRKRNVVSRP